MSLFRMGYPNAGSYSVSTNADNVRTSLQALREMLAAGSVVPGFESTLTPTGAPPTSIVTSERTNVAAADTPSRGAALRIFMRQTLTYTAGAVTKIRYEISFDSGTTYANWVDLAGNAYQNFAYSSGFLSTSTWATS